MESTRLVTETRSGYGEGGHGEILSAEEMVKLIDDYGYQCESFCSKSSLKETFIKASLRRDRPVIFSFTMSEPCSTIPDGGPTVAMKDDTRTSIGSHFSLNWRKHLWNEV